MDERNSSAERTLHLEIPLLLPGVEDGRDQCVERLQESLLPVAGIRLAHVEHADGAAVLCLHYDPDLLSLDRVERLARKAGVAITERYRHESLHVIGMDCADCAVSLEHILRRTPGMINSAVSYAAEKIRVEYDAKAISHEDVIRRIRGLGYDVVQKRRETWWDLHAELILTLLAGTLLTVGFVGETYLGLPHGLAVAAYALAYLSAGYDIAGHAIVAALNLRFDVDVLMILAAIGAAALGDWPEGAFLLFLFSLGHALEKAALDKARHAIEALGQLTPKTAHVRRLGVEQETTVEGLLRGDVVIVRPGERLPADGRLIRGSTTIDQGPVTGESMPVQKEVGDEVFAGTINGAGAIEVDVTKLSADSTLARVFQLIEEAQTQKSPTQRTVERLQGWFVPAVLGAVVLTAVLPPALGLLSLRQALIRAISLLVAASPCALALATPSAVLAGIAQGARNGVLIKGGVHLENLGLVRAVAFDKTGTLTRGSPQVTNAIPMGDATSQQLLRVAASLESRSAHPLAVAVVRHVSDLGLRFEAPDRLSDASGLGVQGELRGEIARVGGERYFTVDEADLPAEMQSVLLRLAAEGKTTMIVQLSGIYLGVIGLADQPRPEARQCLASLKSAGMGPIVMLTGDHRAVAEAVAAEVGVTQVEAGLMPDDKVRTVMSLRKRYAHVAMVGDGVNDAPALAAATVGIAMGGAGTDVALETADVALMADDLLALPYAFALGRLTRQIVIQNLTIAMGVIGVLVLAAVTGLTGVGPAIVVHESSTLLVVLNALRLLGFRKT